MLNKKKEVFKMKTSVEDRICILEKEIRKKTQELKTLKALDKDIDKEFDNYTRIYLNNSYRDDFNLLFSLRDFRVKLNQKMDGAYIFNVDEVYKRLNIYCNKNDLLMLVGKLPTVGYPFLHLKGRPKDEAFTIICSKKSALFSEIKSNVNK